jgi:hypothetical protein
MNILILLFTICFCFRIPRPEKQNLLHDNDTLNED